MRTMFTAALAVVAASVLVPSAALAVPAGTQQSTSGTVTATLSWKASKRKYDGVESARLKITRAGLPTLDAGIGDLCKHCFFNEDEEQPNVEVRDLDGDGEPEVLVQAFTGGAHCCTDLGIWDFRPELGTYGHLIHYLGNAGYSLEDLDGDGKVEILTADDRFAYTFAAYVFSLRPTQVFAYRGGPKAGLRDVTRSHLGLIRQEATYFRKLLRGSLRSRKDEDVDLRGPLAAYVADMYLLGRGKEARKEIARVRRAHRLGSTKDRVWPGGKRFEPELLSFLKNTGYRR